MDANITGETAAHTRGSSSTGVRHGDAAGARPHRGVIMTGDDGMDGPKAFYIEIEARPGKEAEVELMLRDILACVEGEPATGPWFGVQHSKTKYAIFEVFPNIAGRQAHIDGGGGDIFRDVARMNAILENPAQVRKVDVLLSKKIFA